MQATEQENMFKCVMKDFHQNIFQKPSNLILRRQHFNLKIDERVRSVAQGERTCLETVFYPQHGISTQKRETRKQTKDSNRHFIKK